MLDKKIRQWTLTALLCLLSVPSFLKADDDKPKSYPVLSGVGMALRTADGEVFINGILPQSPAEKSGILRENTRIVSVQTSKTRTLLSGKSIGEAASLIRGAVGTEVILSVVLPGEDAETEVKLVREALALPDIPNSSYEPLIGKPIPEVEFTDLKSEEQIKLSNFSGKIVVLDFWATWCHTCYAPVEKLQAICKRHPEWSDRVQFATISADAELDNAKKTIEEKQWNQTLNLSASEESLERLSVQVLPIIIIIDSKGKIAYMGAAHAIDIEQKVGQLLSPESER